MSSDEEKNAKDANASLPLSTSDLEQAVRIRMGPEGQATIPSKTVMESFDLAVTKFGDLPALHQKRIAPGKSAADTPWTTWTWKEYRGQVDAFAKALMSEAIKFERFDVVNVLGFNAPEWLFANFGAVAAGGVAAGIYTTNAPAACKYISHHSKAKVVVCEGLAQLDKYRSISKELPSLKALVVYGLAQIADDVKLQYSVPVYTFAEFLELGSNKEKGVSDDDLKARSQSWKCGEVCTLIYTSGTTGPPKAVMLTNDNVTWTVDTALKATPKGYMDTDDVMISYLPLSHVAAQLIDMHAPMSAGFQIYFAQPDALKGSLAATLKEVRPTAFFGVPRVWEKFYDKLQEVGKASTGIKKKLSTWAKSHALAYWEGQEYGAAPYHSMVWWVAKLLLGKVHQALGFDRCEAFYVGAAPLELKVFKYFASLNVPIMELFGQSECTGPHSMNRPSALKFGSVGRPLLGTESKIDPATGELCYRGRHIFAGYLGMPDKTDEAIDAEGWLHSGDVAKIDDDNNPDIPPPSGFVSITGRIKELIITAGGENVPPVLIEEHVKDALPAVSNVMVIGDKRKFLTALLCLQVEVDADTGEPTRRLTGHALDVSKEIGSAAVTTDEARDDAKWQAYLDDGIAKANEVVTSRAQRIGKWALLGTDFSEVGGELTPTLKLKRSVAADKYTVEIEKMYA